MHNQHALFLATPPQLTLPGCLPACLQQAGDLGDSESSNKFKSLEDKLAEVGQGLKDKLSPRGGSPGGATAHM